MNTRILFTALFGLLLGLASIAWAEHPVSIVNANIYVQKYKTTMRLECYAEDLDFLQGVEPMDDGFYDPNELLDAHDDHAKFLGEKIEVINSKGERLVPRVTNIGPFEIPRDGLKSGQLMTIRLQYELEFKHEEPPEFLTINQKLVAEGMVNPSELHIVIQQAGSEEVLFMMKPETPKVFAFDWNNPLSSEASDEERLKWFEAQQDRNLGIASFSAVYNFLYITDHQVRQEVLIPVATLATFIDFDNADEKFLEIEEQDGAKPLIEALFGSSQNEVKIDGILVKPVFDRIEFQSLEKIDFMTNSPRDRVSMYNGRVGIIMSYSAKSPPQKVETHWQIFNEVLKSVDNRVIAYDKAEISEFNRFDVDDAYTWADNSRPSLPPISNVDSSKYQLSRFEIPLVTIGMVLLAAVLLLFGRALLGTSLAVSLALSCLVGSYFLMGTGVYSMPSSEAETIKKTDAIFAQLHKNVFRAFDYGDKEKVYDALAQSVAGAQLQEFYLDVRNSLRVQEKGGAIANIQEVNFLEGQRIPMSVSTGNPGFGYNSKWNLVGTIEHFGHIHERTTFYQADFDVELIDNSWKITRMQSTEQKHGPINNSRKRFKEIKDLRKKIDEGTAANVPKESADDDSPVDPKTPADTSEKSESP